MEEIFIQLNWPGILLATFVYSAFSGIWHKQFAFGRKWEAAMGFKRPEHWKETNIYYIVPTIGCFIASFSMGLLHAWLAIADLPAAIQLGSIIGLGIGSTTTFTNAVLPIMPRPLVFGLITGSAHAISLVLVSVILALV